MTDEQLTRLLAIKVMGWPVVTTFEEAGRLSIEGKTGYFAEITEPGFMGVVHPPAAFRPKGEPWHPLESVEHAWDAWNRLAFVGEWTLSQNPSGGVTAIFASWAVNARRDSVREETAARAICLCALRAVGIDPEGSEP